MSNVARQVRVAFRGLARTPAFTASAILILGFGIGTAVAMFTVFRAVLLERLPVQDPDRVVVISTYKDPAVEFGLVRSHVDVINREAKTIKVAGSYAHWGATPAPLRDGDRIVELGRTVVSGTFFEALGTHALLGRLIRREDEAHGAAPVIVLSYKSWQHAFGGEPHIVGRRLYEPYSQVTYTVIGVAPAGLDFPSGAGYWYCWPDVKSLSVIAVARLAPGATPRAASAEVFSLVSRESPELHLVGAKTVELPQAMVGDVRPVLMVLTAAVGLLLLIACVNVGNLLLLRAGGRARELAVRRALGATYGDVVRQLLVECALLAIAGGVLGVACAAALVRVLLAFAPAQLPRADVIGISGMPVAASLAITIGAVLVFGVVPSLLAARGDVAATLRLDARSGRESVGRRRVRQMLVGAQTTLALVMIAGGVLLARSLQHLEAIDLGYMPEHLSALGVSWPAKRLNSTDKLIPDGEDIVRRWRAMPGVVAVTPTLIAPLLGPDVFLGRLDIEGQSDADRASNPIVPVEAGNADYFRTFGIAVRRGRGFTDADDERAPSVAVVSESVARRFWPGQDPIGKRIHYWGTDSTQWRTVIGVVGDTHLRTMTESTPAVFIPWRQAGFWQFNFAIRTSGSLASVMPALRRELAAVDPELNLWYAKPMDQLLAAPLARPRMSTMLMGAFGIAALFLAAVGLYGLMSSFVRERTREIGIRMALGAAPEVLRREVLGHAFRVAGTGAVVGLVAALLATRLLRSLLYDVTPTDPLALGGACVILMIVVLVAAYAPARAATRVDPAIALRSD